MIKLQTWYRSIAERLHYAKLREQRLATNVNDWVHYYDDEGDPYYYNTVTKQTSWTKPIGYVDHDAVAAADAVVKAGWGEGVETGYASDSTADTVSTVGTLQSTKALKKKTNLSTSKGSVFLGGGSATAEWTEHYDEDTQVGKKGS